MLEGRAGLLLTYVNSAEHRPATLRLMNEAARKAELERALRLLRTGKDPVEVVAMLSHRLTAKLLHAPTRALAGRPAPLDLR